MKPSQSWKAIAIVALVCLVAMCQAETYNWYYSTPATTPCSNTQCGLGFVTRTVICVNGQNQQVDQNFCLETRGPAVTKLECFYNPKSETQLCGNDKYPGLSHDCVYNPNEAESTTKYQICQCKNGFSGEFCEVAPANPPVPTPPPTPEPDIVDDDTGDKKEFPWKLTFTVILFVAIVLVGVATGVYVYRRKKTAKADRSKSLHQPSELMGGDQGRYEEMDSTPNSYA